MQWPIPPFPTKVVTSDQVNLAAGSTANTKNTWKTLIDGLTAPASWINLGADKLSTSGDRSVLLDLAIGEAGSETIVAADLVFGFRYDRGTMFPLHVPAGATLRGRISCSITFEFVRIRTTAFMGEPDSGLTTPGKIATYGAVPASSGATTVTPSGSSNVKGSYAQLTAATTAPIHALMVLVQGSSGTITNGEYLIDIAVGSSGSETIIVPDHSVLVQDTEFVHPRSPEFYPLSMAIPAGVRLSARCLVVNSSITVPVEVAVYGFTY